MLDSKRVDDKQVLYSGKVVLLLALPKYLQDKVWRVVKRVVEMALLSLALGAKGKCNRIATKPNLNLAAELEVPLNSGLSF